MSMRDTSLSALRELERAGKARGRRATVLRTVLAANCALSRAEIARRTGLTLQTVCGRVHELIHQYGCLDEVPHLIVCPVTGERVHGVVPVWSHEQQELFTDAA